jgi:hypothetical protein
MNPQPTHDNDFCRAFTGFQGVWYGGAWQTYLNTSDLMILHFEWVIRAKGTGTIKVYDQIDNDFLYLLPTNLVATVDVAATDWTDIVVPTTTFGIDEAADTDNEFELGIEVTSGTVDIDVVNFQMRTFIPVFIGAEVLHVSEEYDEIPQVATVATSQPTDPTSLFSYFGPDGLDFDGAWADWQAAVGAGDDWVEKAGPTDVKPGWGQARNAVGTSWSSGTGGPFWKFLAQIWYTSVYLSPDPEPLGWSDGDEGADWARYPDRGYRDWDAYWRWSGTARPSVSAWTNDTLHVDYNTAGDDAGPNDVGFQVVGNTPGGYYDDWAPTRIVIPPDVSAGTVYEANDGDPGVPQEAFVSGILPYEFTFYVIASNELNTVQPVEGAAGGGTGDGNGLQIIVEVGSEADPLTATINIPAYHYYSPNAAPTDGVLKVYGDDLEWHTLGIGDPGRIRLFTEDLTWWEEKRSGETGSQSKYLQTPWDWVYELPMRPMP